MIFFAVWTFSVPCLSHPTRSLEWIRLWKWRSVCPLHHLLIRVLALTAQNWINLGDPCCCFPSRGQPHITALSLRQQHTLLNEILFLPLPPSCLSLCLYLPLACCINPGVIFCSSDLSDWSSLSSFWAALEFCVIADVGRDRSASVDIADTNIYDKWLTRQAVLLTTGKAGIEAQFPWLDSIAG